MNLIDAKSARHISDNAPYGVEEILKVFNAKIKSRAKVGLNHTSCTFSKENVSRVEIDTAILNIRAKAFTTELSELVGFFKVSIRW